MKRSLRVMLLAATVFTPSLAMAQDAPAEEGGIKDIVVTARKTQETLSDAPVAVSVVTSEKINELGLNSIDDFAKQSTGHQLQPGLRAHHRSPGDPRPIERAGGRAGGR